MSDNVTPLVFHSDKDITNPVIRLSEKDTVGVALRPLKVGETVDGVTVQQPISKGHKMAMTDIDAGERVYKYAQMIGVASEKVTAGSHVHSHNLDFQLSDSDYQFGTDVRPVDIACTDHFMGFHRPDGRVGTRNFIAVISSVNCSATVAHRMAAGINASDVLKNYPNIDGVAAFTHGTGCGLADSGDGFDNLQRVFAGIAQHPNVGGVVFVGLGCEVSQISGTLKAHALAQGPLLRTMNIQTIGGHRKTIEYGCSLITEMLEEVNSLARSQAPASSLTLALQCGGSDAWSGITANPALGYASDLLVRQGGTVVLAETPEVYGAEHLLTQRAVEENVGRDLIDRIDWWQAYVSRNFGSMDNNPSPGNKLGGLTTILEKSLGAVAKGGTTPLTAVYRYAERIEKTGFVFMDSPGYDPASVTGQIAGGCNLVAFTTGRGSTFGSKPAPCLKISTNTDMYDRLEDDMDINAGSIVSDGDSIEIVGNRIYQRLLEVASGSATLSESHGLGDNEFVPWQIGATM
ncbi:MAG: altronate dehydratase family protein [Gammaproteobacteria bacterium]|nr:altronate dehydratase family protein [Gammaproteobacteria bacterium]